MNTNHIKDSKERLFIMTQTNDLRRRIWVLSEGGQKNDSEYRCYEKEDKRRECTRVLSEGMQKDDNGYGRHQREGRKKTMDMDDVGGKAERRH